VRLFTIGTTGTTAEAFFTTLRDAGVRRILDVRLRGNGQLDGFGRRRDLAYFARALVGAEFEHAVEAAPTDEMLDGVRSKSMPWEEYERRYGALFAERGLARAFPPARIDGACLVCSEHTPEHCHRRLLAERLVAHHGGEIVHLVP
jgi:uncharacterized protein (DUF488 family)